VGKNCNNTVKLVMRIIKYYVEYKVKGKRYRVVFIDNKMVREFVKRLNCKRKPKSLSKITSKITHTLACLAVRYGGFFMIIGRELWIDLPIRAISKAQEQELISVIYECTTKRAWQELRKAKSMQ